jgi:DNA-binding CsgD family transcriptional regulator
MVLALSLADTGRHDEARAVVEAGLAERRSGDDRSILLTVAAELAWLRADLRGAVRLGQEASALGPGWFGITAGAACAAALGQLELSDRSVSEPPPLPTVPIFAMWVRMTAALHRWGQGDDRGAIAELDGLDEGWAAIETPRYRLINRWAAAFIALRCREPSYRRRLTEVGAEAEARQLRPLVWRTAVALTLGDPAKALTARETAVLALAGEGCSSQVIAERLGIARVTVESHVRSAMRKLGATTRRQAVSTFDRLSASPGER